MSGNQDLESNSMVLGLPVPGVNVLFVSDPAEDVWFSGNNVRGRLYSLNAENQVLSSYFGEVTRLVKIGGNVIACQFYVYPVPGDPAVRNVPSQTLLVNISGAFVTGQTIKTSSDPVAAYFNSLLPAAAAPVANADVGTAVEAGGLNNAVAGSNASGSLLANDSGAATTYSLDNSVSPPVLRETVGGLRVTSVVNRAAASTATVVPATGSASASGLYGTLSLTAAGTFTYQSNEGHAAVQALRLSSHRLADVFTYTVMDERGKSSTSTLTVTIQGANDTPVAVADYNIAKESLRTDATAYDGTDALGYKALGNVLPNDLDVDRNGEVLALSGLVATAVGSTNSTPVLTISGASSNIQAGYYVFRYNTTTSPRGAALLTVAGAHITVATKTPSITLSAPPAGGVSNNETLYFALKADGTGAGGTAVVATTTATSGTSVLLDPASLTGTVVQGMSVSGTGVGTGTTVTAVTYDGSGRTSVITLSQAVSVLSTPLTFTAPLGSTLTGRYGDLVLQANGSYVYTPFKNNPEIAAGSSVVDSFAYRMTDLEARTSDGMLYVTVLGSSAQDPDAVADVLAATEAGGTANGTAGVNPTSGASGLLANDLARDGGTLSVTAGRSDQSSTAATLAASSVTAPGGATYDVKLTGLYGDLYLRANGAYLYTVNNTHAEIEALKTGSSLSDGFQYKVRNSVAGMEDWAPVTVVISGAYDAPVAVADTASVKDQHTLTAAGQVLSNDTDVDASDTKVVSRAGGTGVAPASTSTSGYTQLTGSYGTLRIGADGSYLYLLDTANAAVRALGEGVSMPTPDVFTYEVKDGGGLTATTTLSITITGSNEAPVNSGPATATLEIGGQFAFTGPASVSVADADNNVAALRLQVAHGALTVNATGASVDLTEGVMTLAGGAKIYFKSTDDGSGFVTENGSASMTLYGSQVQINAALASLIYTPASGFTGADTLSLLTVDDGGLQDVDSVALTVLDVPAVADVMVNESSPYAVFMLCGTAGQQVRLSLIDVTATSADYGPGLETWNGSTWLPYVPGSLVSLPASGELAVRTPIASDDEMEGAHAFQLRVTNANNVFKTATGTILDDGTGSYWIGTSRTPASPGDLAAAGFSLDDDRPLTVSSPTVNEASPYAVFTVGGVEGQMVKLELGETGTDYTSGHAQLGTDLGTALEYWNGSLWQSYTPGSYVMIPMAGGSINGEAASLIVRVAVKPDSKSEGAETFKLTAMNTGGRSTDGIGTITDNGTGDVYLGDKPDGAPNAVTDADYPRLDDDSAVIVKWGIAGAAPAAGLLDATIIPTTTPAPLIYAGMNDGRFDLHLTTQGLATSSLIMMGGEASLAVHSRTTPGTAKFRFYQPGTAVPYSLTNIYFSFEDAEATEELSNFIYWDASGNPVSLPWNSPVFSYSHGAVLKTSNTAVYNNTPVVGKPQAGKWIRVDLRGIAVTGIQFSYRMASAGAGTVQMTHLTGEPGKFGFDVKDAFRFAPLTVKADRNDQAPMPDYRSQMTWDAALTGAVVSQVPAPGTLMAVGDHPVTMTLTTADAETATKGFVMTVRAAKKPVLTVTTPAISKTSVEALAPYAVTGRVTDPEGVGMDRVEVVHNGVTLLAALSGAPGDAARNWSLDLMPTLGTNVLNIVAIDKTGISSVAVTRSFAFTRRYALQVSASGAAGTLGIKAAAGGGFTLVGSTPPLSTYSVRVGSVMTLTAAPKTGTVFSHWTDVPSGAVVSGKQVSFTMPGANVGRITAHFVTNPFVAPAGQGTVFAGLLSPEAPAATGITTVGYVTGTLTTTGVFSGQIMNGGQTDRFSATFYGDGRALFTLAPGVTGTSLGLKGGRTLELGFDPALGTVTATLVQAGKTSRATLLRTVHSAANKVAPDLLNRKTASTLASNNQGSFTAALPALSQTPTMPSTSYPQGSGYATATLTDTGAVRVTGVLADGTAFTAASVLTGSTTAPVFAQLKTPGGTTLLGSLGGPLAFAVARDSDVSSSGLLWIRPGVSQQTGTSATAVATRLYTQGWPAGITVGFAGALYPSGLTVEGMLSLVPSDAGRGNAELQFYDGKLAAPVTLRNFNVAGNTVTKIPASDKNYTVTLTPANGQFSGTFTPNWTNAVTRKPVFKGILVVKGASGPAGYGFFLSNRSGDLDPESGEVSIGAPIP